MPERESHEVPVTRGELRDLQIDGFGDGPDGIGRIGRYIVFVPGVLPGERVRVRITSAARKFGRGELVAVKRSSHDRVDPRCRHFLACGGCHRQHLDYRAQLTSKQELVQKVVDRALGDGAVEVAATQPTGGYEQRHKVALQVYNGPNGEIEAGFHRLRSLAFVPVQECPASEPAAFRLAQRTVELLRRTRQHAFDPESAPDGLLRAVLVRRTTVGEAHVVVVATRPQVPGLDRILPDLHTAGATTISTNHNDRELSVLLGPRTVVRAGPPRIRERIDGIDYLLSPEAFFQTSPTGAAAIVRFVLEWLAPGGDDDVADLYCGGGLLTLPLARRARHVVAIEASATAVADGEAAAAAQGIPNITWRQGDVTQWLTPRGLGTRRPRLVVTDPPRAGLAAPVVRALAGLAPVRLAHVSCDVEALGRDLGALTEAGFRVRSVMPLDMFPATCHVETLVALDGPRR